jgi:hypothetical protein
VAIARADAARRTGVPAASWGVVEVSYVTWPDPGLGCPEPGALYPQVLTEGYRIRLESGGRVLEYHSGGGRVVFCK